MREIRHLDLFRGIGGFHLGLERATGYRCVWSNDIDKYASIIYKNHWPDTPEVTGDIRGVDEKTIPQHDLLCAGFPCQAFSVAGKRKGFEDTRGTLFFEICRIAAYHRPELLLLENVKGLLNHDGGRTFATILYALEDMGYWWEYQVLNSKNYGVPQNRERVFIIGHLREGSSRPIFPITKSVGLSDKENQGERESRTGVRGGISPTIDARYGALRNAGEPYIMNIPHGYNDGFKKPLPGLKSNRGAQYNELLVHPIATGVNMPSRGPEPRKDMLASTIKVSHPNPIMEINAIHYGDSQQDRLHFIDGISPTMPSNRAQNKLKITDGVRIRRLTPMECERLQGFPDGWTEGVSDTQRYKCLGNAVTVNVVEFLGRKLRESINSKSKRINQE